MAFVLHVLMISISLGVSFIKAQSLNAALLIACLLETLLVYKLLLVLVYMMCGTPAQMNRTMRELRGRGGGPGSAAGEGVVPNGQVPNGRNLNGQITNEQVANRFAEAAL